MENYIEGMKLAWIISYNHTVISLSSVKARGTLKVAKRVAGYAHSLHWGHTSGYDSCVAGEDLGVDEPLTLQFLPEGDVPVEKVEHQDFCELA